MTNSNLSLKILKIIGFGIGLIAVSILAPQFPYILLKAYLSGKLNNKYSKKQIHDSLHYLKQKRFIKYKINKNNIEVLITKSGQKHLENKKTVDLSISSTKWDGKWRMVIFDIPEYKKVNRNLFRKTLKQLGFVYFQKSVFIQPYPCEKNIKILSKLIDVNDCVCLLTCDRFNNDNKLIKLFKIKS